MACATRLTPHPVRVVAPYQFPFGQQVSLELGSAAATRARKRPAKSTSGHVSGSRNPAAVPKASTGGDAGVSDDDVEEDGVSLGTMKLPPDTDLVRFEALIFQWANSLSQGAMLPLPTPLKVDKIAGGARLGFITIGDEGKTEVPVYIDCLVIAASGGSGPVFWAVRNGPMKNQSPPGEPRIMRSLLSALKKSVRIANV